MKGMDVTISRVAFQDILLYTVAMATVASTGDVLKEVMDSMRNDNLSGSEHVEKAIAELQLAIGVIQKEISYRMPASS